MSMLQAAVTHSVIGAACVVERSLGFGDIFKLAGMTDTGQDPEPAAQDDSRRSNGRDVDDARLSPHHDAQDCSQLASRKAVQSFVIVCWTLGLTSALTTYSVADGYFFRPAAHVAEPARVGRLYAVQPRAVDRRSTVTRFSYPYFEALASATTGASVAGYSTTVENIVIGDAMISSNIAIVSRNYFDVLGTTAQSGRMFEDRKAASPGNAEIVLSPRVWRVYAAAQRAGAAPPPIRVRDRAFSVVGVAPEHFNGGELTPIDAWILLEDAGEFVRGPE